MRALKSQYTLIRFKQKGVPSRRGTMRWRFVLILQELSDALVFNWHVEPILPSPTPSEPFHQLAFRGSLNQLCLWHYRWWQLLLLWLRGFPRFKASRHVLCVVYTPDQLVDEIIPPIVRLLTSLMMLKSISISIYTSVNLSKRRWSVTFLKEHSWS